MHPCNTLESTQLHHYITVQVHDLINLFRNALVTRFLRVLGTFGRRRFSEVANLGIPIWAWTSSVWMVGDSYRPSLPMRLHQGCPPSEPTGWSREILKCQQTNCHWHDIPGLYVEPFWSIVQHWPQLRSVILRCHSWRYQQPSTQNVPSLNNNY